MMKDRTITIAGQLRFKEREWRNGITCFFSSLQRGIPEVVGQPEISFGQNRLRLDQKLGRCLVYQIGDDDNLPANLIPDLIVGDGAWEVEAGLMRFVKNDNIKVFTIQFRDQPLAEMTLTKTDRRSQYRCGLVRWMIEDNDEADDAICLGPDPGPQMTPFNDPPGPGFKAPKEFTHFLGD